LFIPAQVGCGTWGDGPVGESHARGRSVNPPADIEGFTIRAATVADIETLVCHRCEMFRDMDQLRDDAYSALAKASARYFAEALPSGEYVAWVVTPTGQPDLIVAGGGVQLRRILPRPDHAGRLQKPGPQGLIVNIYTEKEWRH